LQSYSIIDGLPLEDFNLNGLILAIQEELKLTIDKNILINLNANEIQDKIYHIVVDEYNQKMQPIDPFIRENIEREFYLKTLDRTWREHLYQMDILKTGIGLRGYNQKDPLVEYKKESFGLFNELVQSIKFETVKTLQLIQFGMRAKEESEKFIEELEKLKEIEKKQNELKQETNIKKEPIIAQKKPRRNEPCPCGSGKKYKQCCGISGPKKGVFAKK
jgi:preprotein translocase subunit SecA